MSKRAAAKATKSKRAAARAAKWARAAAIKVSRGCESGYCQVDPAIVKSNPLFLDFDHLPGFIKRGNVSDLIRRDCGWTTIMAEIAKCRVLCKFCHALHTDNQRNN